MTFNVIIPTLDGFVLSSLDDAVSRIAQRMGEGLVKVVPTRFGVVNSLGEGCRTMGELLGSESFRALMVGSDTYIENPDETAEVLAEAAKLGYDVVGSVHIRSPTGEMQSSIMHEDGTHFTDAELDKLEAFAPVPMSGLGFYYGRMFKSYVWHSDSLPEGREDFYFQRENNISLRFAKGVRLRHYVRVYL